MFFFAQNRQLGVVYEAQDMKVKARKEELQGSKLCLLNVLLSEDFVDDVVNKMNLTTKVKMSSMSEKREITSISGAASLRHTMTQQVTKFKEYSLLLRMSKLGSSPNG